MTHFPKWLRKSAKILLYKTKKLRNSESAGGSDQLSHGRKDTWKQTTTPPPAPLPFRVCQLPFPLWHHRYVSRSQWWQREGVGQEYQEHLPLAMLWTLDIDFPFSTIITAFEWKKTRIGFCIYWCYIARLVHYRWTNAFTKLCTDAAQSFFLLKNLTILKFWCFFKRFFLEFF